jgi:hypothetical protein
MNFEFGEVLSRAVQITWKHKVFWGFIILPMLAGFLIVPLTLSPIFLMDGGSFGSPSYFENPIFIVLFIGLHLMLALASLVLTAIGYSSLTLGIVRAERGEDGLTFKGLLQDGMKYFPRMLGVMLLLAVGISLIFFSIFACGALFGMVTAGIGFICIQPLILALYPVMVVLYALIEQSQAAIVADDLGVTQAIAKGWELLRANFWRYVLISLIVHLGIGILSSIVLMPFMLPFFFLPFLMDSSIFDSGPQAFGLIIAGSMLILLPVMAVVQGVTITFMKSAYVLVYLRLAHSSNAPITPGANA